MIVMKFGGTSTQDAAAMYNVAAIVKTRRERSPIVVISAIAQATNALENAGRLASEGRDDEALELLRTLIRRHSAIIQERIKNTERRAQLDEILTVAMGELEQLVRGVSILGELTPRTKDAFYSYGELLSSRIVAAVLQEEGVEAQWIDTKEFMITDENFNSATPRMEIVGERLHAIVLPLIKKGIVPVTQGFIGSTPSGRRTTMGRESSDYSAAVIGAAVAADDIEIWTDVDGVLSADPRVVGSPLKVKVLTFDEAFELSFFGAKVLHPNTMLPAIEKNIPIHVYNSRRPERSGTSVTSAAPASGASVVKSVAYSKVLKKKVASVNKTPILPTIQSPHDLPGLSLPQLERLAAEMREVLCNLVSCRSAHFASNLGVVEVLTNKAILCLVGMNIQSDRQLLKKLFAAIEPAAATMVSFGATSSSVSLVVDEEHVLDAVKSLHAAFFPSSGSDEIFESLG